MDDRTQPDGTLQVREVNIPELHEMIEGMLPQLPADVPILLTEFGADSVPKFYSSACELWSENYHAKVVKTVVEESRRHPEVAGTFVFNFTDYNDPSKAVNGRWNGFNLKGMVTYGREYKLPFYALQEVYGKK